jgi:methyl-accepting chemotaxis protein
MADANGSLTLEGLAQILRDHMHGTAAGFAELRGEIGTVATVVRDLAQIVARQHDDLEEHRRYIAQIFSRMEQHDARFEEISRDIRRILDALERLGGDGGDRGT